MTKQYSFFYHFFKAKKAMSIHWRGSCTVVDNVVCKVPCETKWNKRQPMLVMKGKAKKVTFKGKTAIIE